MKRPAVVLLAAALALGLSATVFAAVNHGSFFRSVFGSGIKGQDAYTVVLSDGSNGTLPKIEHYPTIERVEVDEEQAETLVGAYVTAVGQSVTLENYTFTLEDVLLDENGVGALTLRVRNPEGHGLIQSGHYTADHLPPFWVNIERSSGDFGFMDDRDYLVEDSFTETEAVYVYYVTPFEPLPADEALTLRVGLRGESELVADWPSAEITIPASDKVPARTFAAGGETASVSPMGMTLRHGLGDGSQKIQSGIVIRYADGSAYVVQGDDIVNIAVSSVSRDKRTEWIAFNRLADAENIVEIQISGHWWDESEEIQTYDLTLTAAE